MARWYRIALMLAPFAACAVAWTLTFAPARGAARPGAGGDAAGEVTQDLLGRLHGKFRKVSKPRQTAPWKADANVRRMRVTPDGKTLVAHVWARGEGKAPIDRVVVVDVATGEPGAVLAETKGELHPYRPVVLLPSEDGSVTTAVLLQKGEDRPAGYDLRTGRRVRQFDPAGSPPGGPLELSADGRRLACPTQSRGAALWDAGTGKVSVVPLEFVPQGARFVVHPLAGSDRLLVQYAVAENRALRFWSGLFDPATGHSRMLSDARCAALPAGDGKRAYLMRQEDPERTAWTSAEVWDLEAGKRVSKHPLRPPLSSIDQKLAGERGAAADGDGGLLFLHEYMVQPVVIWDLRRRPADGRPLPLLAVVGPEGGGCHNFDVTPDGKKLVAVAGTWRQGGLVPLEEPLVTYDLSEALGAGRPGAAGGAAGSRKKGRTRR